MIATRPPRANQRSVYAWLVGCLAALLALPLGGCRETVPFLRHQSAKVPPAAPKEPTVQLDGKGVILAEPDKDAIAPGAFLHRVQELHQAGHATATRRYIERYPDVALHVLRESTAAQAAHPVLRRIAEVYDQQCCRCGAEAGWSALLAERRQQPRHHADYETRRRQMVERMQAKRYTEAAALSLIAQVPRKSGSPLVEIDAAHLHGTALLMINQPGKAEEILRHAADLARAYPHQATHILLLLSEAQRRGGDDAGATQTWQSAAELASNLLNGSAPVLDPGFWERCAYLRPVQNDWPTLAQHQLRQFNGTPELSAPDDSPVRWAAHQEEPSHQVVSEALVWTCIGRCRLERQEHNAALLAFKHAEAWTLEEQDRDRLRLRQAQVFAQMKQREAALALLVQLVNRPQPSISCPALALMGAIKLEDGSIQQGLAFLRKAVEEQASVDWPERGEAQANLGLAYLMIGDEATGLRWLHTAQERFMADKDEEHLRQCYQNEIAYLEQAGKRKQAHALRERLKQRGQEPHVSPL
ncbi:MAG: tetratricopeptide repeat protein [Gemmataceae bacterium]